MSTTMGLLSVMAFPVFRKPSMAELMITVSMRWIPSILDGGFSVPPHLYSMAPLVVLLHDPLPSPLF